MATALEQAVFLGNGVGVVYFTGPSGVLGATPYIPSRGEYNGYLAKTMVEQIAVTALNSYVASPDWSAYSIGATFFVRCNTAGSANNNLPIVLTFSGASTASYPAVTAGGTDSNQYGTRIFLDLNPAADPAILNMGSAVEITSAVAALPPYTTVDVPVVSSSVTTSRQDRNNGIAVTGRG